MILSTRASKKSTENVFVLLLILSIDAQQNTIHSLDPLGNGRPLGVQQMPPAVLHTTVPIVQRIRRLVRALRQQLLDAHIVRRIIVRTEAHPLQDKVHDRMADRLRKEAGLLLVEAANEKRAAVQPIALDRTHSHPTLTDNYDSARTRASADTPPSGTRSHPDRQSQTVARKSP